MKNFVFGLMIFGCMAGAMSRDVEGMKAGEVVLPEMISTDGRLKIQELKVPDCLDNYDKAPEIRDIKLRLKDISDMGINNLTRVPELVDNLIGDDNARDNLFSQMTEDDNGALYFMRNQIAIRLFELGDLDFCWVMALFCSQRDGVAQAYADCLLYDGEPVSRDLIALAGEYIAAFDEIRTGLSGLSVNLAPAIDMQKLPTTGYVSWALSMAKRH